MAERFLFSFLFGILCLDKKQAFQVLISQPLFTGLIIGLYFDNLVPVLFFSAILQLLWIGFLPIGASVVPEGEIASVAGIWLYAYSYDSFSFSLQFLSLFVVLFTIGWSFASSIVQNLVYKINVSLLNRFNDEIVHEHDISFTKFLVRIFSLQIVVNFFLIFIGTGFSLFILNLIPQSWILKYNRLWNYADLAVLAAGLGITASLYNTRKKKTFIAAFSLIVILLFFYL